MDEKPNFYSWFVKAFVPRVRKMNLIPPEQSQHQETPPRDSPSSSDMQGSPSSGHDQEGPGVILFFDGHYSHVNLDVIRVAQENNITLVTLPPNTTHALQPLDVGVFAPMKKAWQKLMTEHKRKTQGRSIDKTMFPSMIRKLTEGSLKKSHLQSAFKGAGLYPYPRAAAIPPSKLAPADAVKTPSRSLSKSSKTPQSSRAARTPALRLQLQKQFSTSISEHAIVLHVPGGKRLETDANMSICCK